MTEIKHIKHISDEKKMLMFLAVDKIFDILEKSGLEHWEFMVILKHMVSAGEDLGINVDILEYDFEL